MHALWLLFAQVKTTQQEISCYKHRKCRVKPTKEMQSHAQK